jgi:membrane peptidoglycan carboxypeptidase
LIGGRNFSHSRFDRTRSSRDLGSAFEPFVAAAAAERGKLVMAGRPLQTGRQIGPAEVARIAKRCGISGHFSETEDLFRGTVNATPLEMSSGLAVLSNKGKLAKPYLIREIRDASDEVIYTAKPELTAAISPNAAADAASVLLALAASPARLAQKKMHGHCASVPVALRQFGSALISQLSSLRKRD